MIKTNVYQHRNTVTTQTSDKQNRAQSWLQTFKQKCSHCYDQLTLWMYQHRYGILISTTICVVITTMLFPQQALATKIDDQLDAIDKIFTDKIKKYGISIATISGGIWALIKGNIKLLGVIVIIGVGLAYFLKWVNGGMTLA